MEVPGKKFQGKILNMNDKNKQPDPKTEELEKRIEELENFWKRAVADYRNLQKRVEEEKVGWKDFANESLLKNLLPVLDNIERVSSHVKDHGLDLTVKDFKQVLKNEGVEEIKSSDEDFDPLVMEAIDVVEGEKNKVIETVLKGYLLQQKLLRPARVKVGGGKSETETKETENSDNSAI